MVKSLVSKLSSASSTLSIASTFGKSHDNSTAAGSSTSASTVISGDNYLKYRNDPGRFFGDGVQFKAKLIGILEVGEARGDRMCQEALQDLKMAIRAAGEHKQRITIHVTIDGLRLRDEKTGDSLYHHPVHKISFIAQDMTDSRAFGYIFGSPDSGHRFFGIKTDKAASQVVLAMRDLFQVVFELKKKEIELARQQIQSKSLHHHDTQHQLSSLSSLKSAAAGTTGQNDLSGLGGSNTSAATLSMLNTMVSSSTNTPNASRLGVNLDSKGASKEISPESVADLVDLEQELSSLQRGISQMERITPNDSHHQQTSTNATKSSVAGGSGSDDPFGDSFTSFPTLPPPEPGRLRSKTTAKPNDTSTTNVPTSTTVGLNATTTTTSSNLQPLDDDDDNWLRELDAHNDVFDTSKTVMPGIMGMPPLASTLSSSVPLASRAPLAARESSDTPPNHIYETVSCSATNNIPTDMVELTNLSNNTASNNIESNVNNLTNSSSLTDIFQTAAAEAQNAKLDIKSEPVNIATNNEAVMLPRDTDPFSPTRKKSDPFEEGGDLFSKLDPFEFEFNNTNLTEVTDKIRKPNTSLSPSAEHLSSNNSQTSQDLLAGHLQVNLPPENDSNQSSSTIRSRPIPGSSITLNQTTASIAPPAAAALPPASMLKQQTVDVISSISNKKMPHLFGQSSRFSKRDSNTINMRRLQESDSLSETETAPEPPPRPDYASCVEPPPLPPKKQFNDFVIRTRTATNHSMNSTNSQSLANNRYDSLNSVMATKTLTGGRSASTDVPPIPLPSRRVGRTDGSYPGPGRPRKPGHTEDDYLAPISMTGSAGGGPSSTGNSLMSDVPPLLPPPTQTSSRTRTQRQQSLTQQSKVHDIYENKNEILQQIQQQQQQQQQQQNILEQHTTSTATIVPDITLTQLLTLGIDELALKLNVPTSKLSTMTLVELTSYLSEFLEQSKPSKVEAKVEAPHDEPPQQTPPIFKVNFDQEATFVAKFDDTFGEDFQQHVSSNASNNTTFEANFAQFDNVSVEPPVQTSLNQNANMVPSADRYAVFREIIDQELQQQQENVDLIGDVMDTEIPAASEDKQFESNTITDLDMNVNQPQDLLSGDMLEVAGPQPPKIDTKITEVLAQAKDRYAALRDLILVENLFDKPPPKPPSITTETESDNKSPFQGFTGFNDDEEDQDLRQLMDQANTLDANTQQQRLGLVDSRGFLVEPSSSAITVEEDEDEEEEDRRNNAREDAGVLSSADSNEKEQDKDTLPSTKYEQLASSNQQLEEIEEKQEKFDDNPQISITQTQMPSNNDSKYLSVVSVASSGLSGSKDDLEIDDLMHRAISNLSLDSRERSSPAVPPVAGQQQNNHTVTTTMTPPHFNDVSTSPIPLQRSPGPSLTSQQNKSSNNKSPQQISPLPTQLTAVSQLIDAATKQIQNDNTSKTSNDSWATFDTPQHQPVVQSDKRARPAAKHVAKANNFLNLPPPPGSISNCSQNDSAIESPCSSDPREEAWHKHTMGGSSLSLGHQTSGNLGGSTQRRYHKKERQNTSSSSRDLSWDEDQGVNIPPPPHMLDYPHKRLAGQLQGSLTTDRHGYYRRHARRMNSCDDEYEYEQDFGTSRRDRDPCKYKHSLSRSRDNFDMDSPGWYHHHGAQHPHHTWSSQDIEQARGRNFERSAYERTTYGPPIYDKRGVGPPLPPTSSYDRRSAGGGVYDKRNKYYRGDSNPRSAERIYNLDEFGDVLAASGKIPPHLASMYEEMKGECCSPTMPTHRQRAAADYMYERDRKSFDRESLESYEGSNVPQRRRRRSYDSGGVPSDPYGSCDSREEYHGRDRCVMTADKSRSLRKSLKSLRVTGDIDYDQDSEKEYHYRDQRSRCDTRSLQRPSQLSTQGVGGGSLGAGSGSSVMGSQGRIRKSSGSSPWDGEEPPLPGQKSSNSSWKRPSSAAEAERRRAAVKGQTPSGSDEDKDRRYRKKRTTRSKDLPAITSSAGRYGRSGNYDYISCEDLDDDAEDYVDEEEEEEERGIEQDDERSPADEDKFARLEMRRHEMHNRMMDAHVRRRKEVPPSQTQMPTMSYRKVGKAGYIRRPLPPPTEPKHPEDYGFDDDGDDGEYEQTPTPRSNTSSALPTATPNASTKFSFDVGFESDFNQSSPPPAPAGTASSCNSTPAANVSAANTPASKSSFRFSNDFSGGQDREKHYQHPPAGSLQQYDLENRVISSPQTSTQTSTPKLRFDDNVKVSQFDDAFEDDFSKATFDAFQNDDVQWQESLQKTAKQQMRNNKMQQRQQELIKKSESVNIFAKKVEDPFEDDEFFNSPPTSTATTTAHDKTETNTNIEGGNGGLGNTTSATSNVAANGGNQITGGWDDDNTNFAKFDENM